MKITNFFMTNKFTHFVKKIYKYYIVIVFILLNISILMYWHDCSL